MLACHSGSGPDCKPMLSISMHLTCPKSMLFEFLSNKALMWLTYSQNVCRLPLLHHLSCLKACGYCNATNHSPITALSLILNVDPLVEHKIYSICMFIFVGTFEAIAQMLSQADSPMFRAEECKVGLIPWTTWGLYSQGICYCPEFISYQDNVFIQCGQSTFYWTTCCMELN